MGELATLYSLANVVFVGGSLAPRGGHNIIEPGAAGVPVVVGPHMHNFEVITRDFLERQAIVQIQGEQDLLPAIRELLTNPRRAADMGKRGQQFVRSQLGVSEAWHCFGGGAATLNAVAPSAAPPDCCRCLYRS
jgi:3-deoxy-D-manno-octulosonic-acid transferase